LGVLTVGFYSNIICENNNNIVGLSGKFFALTRGNLSRGKNIGKGIEFVLPTKIETKIWV